MWRRYFCPSCRQPHNSSQAENSDTLLYLAGVNEHAVLHIVGSKRWSLAHFLSAIHYFFSNKEFASEKLDATDLMLLYEP